MFTQDEPSDLLYMSANYYRELIHRLYSGSRLSAEAKTHLASVLVNCKALEDSYWLSRRSPLIVRDSRTVPRVYPWHPLIGSHIEQRAIDTLLNPPADRKLYAQAIIILRTLNSKGYHRSEMPSRRAEIVEGLHAAFKRLQASGADLFEVHAFSGREFDSFLVERGVEPFTVFSPTLLERAKSLHFRVPGGAPVVITSLELVALVETLMAGDELKDELGWLFETTSALNGELFAMSSSDYATNNDWPELRSPDTLPLSRAPTAEGQKPSKATREHWIAALLHTEAYRALTEKAQTELKRESVRKREATLVAELVRQHDTDGNGQLSFDEAKELIADPNKVDANGDQQLSADELIEFRVDEAVAPAVSDIHPDTLDWAKRTIEKYDKNRDGELTPDECSSMVVKPDGADLDHNGKITVEEYAKFRQGKSSSSVTR